MGYKLKVKDLCLADRYDVLTILSVRLRRRGRPHPSLPARWLRRGYCLATTTLSALSAPTAGGA